MTQDWFVYIVHCNDGTYYTGITVELARRIDEHNNCNKKGAKYTRARRPVLLVWHEPAKDKSSASKREYIVRKLTRQKKQKLVDGFVHTHS